MGMEIRRKAGEPSVDESSKALAAKPIRVQLASLENAAIWLYASVQIPRSNLYMGSVDMVNEQIALHSGQQSSLNLVSTVIGFTIPLGVFAVPAIDACVQRGGILWT